MANSTNLRVVHGAPSSGPWSRVEWRFPLGLFTTALFLRGAVTLLDLLLPHHRLAAEFIAVVLVFAWRAGLHQLGVFPWDWDRARGLSFSFLQAILDACALFVFMVAVFSLGKSVLPREIQIAAVFALFYGLYSGSFARPRHSA
jgi:hypothetical protein